MENYLQPLVQSFEAAQNPDKAIWAKKYMKNQYDFYGLDAKTLRQVLKDFIKQHGLPAESKMEEFCLYVWALPEREYQQVAVEILHNYYKQYELADIYWIEKLIVSKSWWDTVDGLAAWVCGSYFMQFPDQIIPVTQQWIKSGNMWLQRSALLFQLKYKGYTDTRLLKKYILQLIDHTDFFIRKAIGWALREYAKTNPNWVRSFVDKYKGSLSGLSYREATKHL